MTTGLAALGGSPAAGVIVCILLSIMGAVIVGSCVWGVAKLIRRLFWKLEKLE